MKFTTAELKVLSNLVDINLTGIGDEALAEEIKSDFGNTFQPVEKAANKKQGKKEQIKAEADFVKKASADTDDDFDDAIPF